MATKWEDVRRKHSPEIEAEIRRKVVSAVTQEGTPQEREIYVR